MRGVVARSRRLPRRAACIALLAGVMTLPVGAIAPTARAQNGDDPALLRELMSRALGNDSASQVTITVGKVAATQPALVAPPGWRILGTIVRSASAAVGSTFSNVYFDAPGTPSEATAAFATAQVPNGWRSLSTTSPPPQGGFLPEGAPQYSNATLCAGTRTFVAVVASRIGSGPTALTANIIDVPASSGSPCASASATRGVPATVVPGLGTYGQLPALKLPAEWRVVAFAGGGGGPFNASSGVTVEGTPAPGDVAGRFDAQMTAIGWKRIGGSSDATAAMSVWRRTVDGTDYQAVVTAVRAIGADNRTDLSVVVSTKADASGSGGPYPTPPFPVVGIAPVATVALGAVAGPPVTDSAASKASATRANVARTRKAKTSARKK